MNECRFLQQLIADTATVTRSLVVSDQQLASKKVSSCQSPCRPSLDFYHTVLFYCSICCRRVSVCLCVSSWCLIQTVKCMIMQMALHSSQQLWSFDAKDLGKIRMGSPQLLLLLLLLHPFNALFFRTTWVSQYQKGKTSLGLNEARDNGVWVWDGGSISWTVCKRSASRCRQIATPTPDRSIFTGCMLFLTSSNSVKALNAKWGHHKWG